MVYKCFDKKSPRVTCALSETSATRDKPAIKDNIVSNQQFAK